MQIFVKKNQGNATTLNVESNERICSIKSKLKEKEGIRSDMHLGLIYNGRLLEDGHTLAHYNILKESTLRLFLSRDSLVETWNIYVETWSRKKFSLNVTSVDTIDDVKAQIQKKTGIPPHKQLLFDIVNKLLEYGSCTLADYDLRNYSTLKLAIQLEQGAWWLMTNNFVDILKMCVQATNPNIVMFGEGPQSAAATYQVAPTKATSIEATAALNKENNKNEEIARKKEKELEATISGLKAGNKKTEEGLMIARKKEKELEATISALTHKNKLFSDQCASYESQVDDLKVENKKTKEELMNADKKYYAGARAAGYAEGLKEGKAKRVKFLHCLNDASMQYFNHGFDSCQKQAEQKGFCGQLNKNSALKDAPEIKGWESSDQPQ